MNRKTATVAPGTTISGRVDLGYPPGKITQPRPTGAFLRTFTRVVMAWMAVTAVLGVCFGLMARTGQQHADRRPAADGTRPGPTPATTAPARSTPPHVVPAGSWQPVQMEVTAYCPCRRCCGPKACGITASGNPVSVNGSQFVAADRSLAFGTMIRIPGYAGGHAVPVLDRGGAIKGRRLDVYFPTHAEALRWGRQHVVVYIWVRQ